MNENAIETRKFIIGWIDLHPGRRQQFMQIAQPYVTRCRSEDGCLFFEMVAGADGPDQVLVCECFRDEAAHARHLQTREFVTFWSTLSDMAVSATFENVIAQNVIPDRKDFVTIRSGS